MMTYPFNEKGVSISYRRLRYYVQTDLPIYQYFFGGFEVDTCYSSPFRRDSNPSFCIHISGEGNLYWRDYGVANQKYFDGIGLVAYMYRTDRQEAMDIIWSELVENRGLVELPDKEIDITAFKKSKTDTYSYEWEDLHYYEKLYWSQRLVYTDVLEDYDIKSLKALNGFGKTLWSSTREKPCFVYLNREDSDIFKAYNPYVRHGAKFRAQNHGSWIQGWEQLPQTADHLFITSSMKDGLVLRSAGALFCAPSSETTRLPLLQRMSEINQRFENVFIFYDSDEAGQQAAKILEVKSNWRWQPVFIPREWGIKDPAELTKKMGNRLRLNEILFNLVKSRYHV